MMNTVFKTMRPSFLILTLACVFLGLCTSLVTKASIDSRLLMLIFISAISAHISVNMLNEYHDFNSGLDFKTVKTPFSGGSGALPNNPKIAKLVLLLGLLALFITALIGIYFISTFWGSIGPQLLTIGFFGLVMIVTYTHWLNRIPWLCLIAPGLGLGLFMVVGTHIVLTFEYSLQVWLIALIPFFLINNLLLLNQYPDMQADVSVGRNTFPLAFGIKRSNQVYALFMVLAYALIAIYIFVGILPEMSVIALMPMMLSSFALAGALKHKSNIGAFQKYLGANVAATLLTPFLLGLSILIG
jgi:1,4-dihydroxy-2-naphthoate octaprenyltransferase